ncbi:MAG TPA: CPBP family glutamic-type intramembrane protease [Candidatus Acidoferrum sp.]|nr:CPBP family glutamic-type intramembrane protease [Candidatus Acidoferrum sp.]
MSNELRAYLLLVAYPAIIVFLIDWSGPGSRWAMKHRSSLLPPAIKGIQETRGRFLLLIKYALVVLAAWGITNRDQRHLLAMEIRTHSWPVVFLSGLFGGVFIFGFRRLLALSWPPIAVSESRDYALRGRISIWLAIFLFGGLAEELWRAFCILSFLQAGQTAFVGAVLPALAFSLAHMSGLPARIPGGLEIACAEAITGLLLGTLFLWSSNFFSPYLASLVYYTLNLYWLRTRQNVSNVGEA